MASDKRSPTPDKITTEDPDTAAARKELRHTVISEKADISTMSTAAKADDPAPKGTTAASDDKAPTKSPTPDRESLDAQKDNMKDLVSSPKKKRAHDEVDEPKDAPLELNREVSPIGANGSTSISRSDRSEPEKKRARDVSSEAKATADETITSTESNENSKPDGETGESAIKKPTEAKNVSDSEKEKKAMTSASAFKNSGMSGFAAQASPFLQAATKPLSSFASPSGSQSPFGAAAATTSTAPAFRGVGNSSIDGASPFGQVGGASKPFGSSVFGGGFGGGASLTSFGKPGGSLQSSKPAKPFGAPASDEEGSSNEGEDADSEINDNEEKEPEEEKATVPDDKKKPKLQRVAVDTGEADEVTILQVRAKIYNLDKASSSWKERGAGNLKINVPQSCVDLDDTGAPIPGSFDASTFPEDESKVVRLIMRQDSTHRVILNTAVIPVMEFQEKSTVKATCVLFTAIEDGGAGVDGSLADTDDTSEYPDEISEGPEDAPEDPEDEASDASNASNASDASDKSDASDAENADIVPASRAQKASSLRDSGYHSSAQVVPDSHPENPSRKRARHSPSPDSDSSSGSPPKRKAIEMQGPMTRARKKRLSEASITNVQY
ncbi:hypothetical protein F4779DRAFT_613937 [Xylariaceae sp. FL0662B]|nr:hypothetical protein F4779DRAFT_613937 [Xylariaceae sp. FL0662B]